MYENKTFFFWLFFVLYIDLGVATVTVATATVRENGATVPTPAVMAPKKRRRRRKASSSANAAVIKKLSDSNAKKKAKKTKQLARAAARVARHKKRGKKQSISKFAPFLPFPKSQKRNKKKLTRSEPVLQRTAAAVSAANDTTDNNNMAVQNMAQQVVTTYTQPNIEIQYTDLDVPLIVRLPRDVYNIVSIFGMCVPLASGLIFFNASLKVL